jgi:hypothetical protein
MIRLSKEKNDLKDAINSLVLKINNLQIKTEHINESINEEYQIGITDLEEYKKDIENFGEYSARTEEIKKTIKSYGNINVGALEEYKEVCERYEFLTGQRDDLLDAKKDIESVIKDVEKLIERKMSMNESGGVTEIGGTKYIAEVMNSVDISTEKYIMEELSKKDPTLSEVIRQCMFVFDDIATLEPIYIQRILQEVTNPTDLLIALKGSTKEVADKFYENMSVRMKESMEEEAKYLHNIRLSDVEEKQTKIVALVRTLEEAGEVFITRGRKDEIIV